MKRKERKRDIFSLCDQVHGHVLYVTCGQSGCQTSWRLIGWKAQSHTCQKKKKRKSSRTHTRAQMISTIVQHVWGFLHSEDMHQFHFFFFNLFFFSVCLLICSSVQQHKGNLMHFLVCYCKQPCWKQPKEKKRKEKAWINAGWFGFPCPRLLGRVSCMPVFALFSGTREEETIFISTLLMKSVPLCFGSVSLCFW